MGVSLDAIYQPLNKFFLQEFGETAGAPVKFRFARTAHTLLESDFIPASQPEFGPSPALAEQVFSVMIDGVPTLDADGRTVWIGPASVSDLYHDEILGPSLPFFPASVTSDADKQTVLDAFSQVKADAQLDWEHSKAASLLPGEEGVLYRPSTPAPQSWWKTTEAAWLPRSFEVAGGATVSTGPANDQILRLKLNDVQARKVLLDRFQSPPIIAKPEPTASMAVKRPMMAMAASAEPAQLHASPMMMARPMLASQSATLALRQNIVRRPASPVVANRIDMANFENAKVLPLRERIIVQSTLGDAAPTQSVVSTDVTISFDYCLVRASRAWMHEAFLNARSWQIPGMAKGELSANDGHGMPAVAVGFVAVKSLKIKAPWTPADITNLQLSVQFGPFKFDSTVVDGAIGHEGVQIVGWLLQEMETLPPNDAA